MYHGHYCAEECPYDDKCKECRAGTWKPTMLNILLRKMGIK